VQATEGAAPEIDPVAARKAAEEAEERRLAEIRSHGTPVSPATFAPWKTRFYAELAAARARCAGLHSHTSPVAMPHGVARFWTCSLTRVA